MTVLHRQNAWGGRQTHHMRTMGRVGPPWFSPRSHVPVLALYNQCASAETTASSLYFTQRLPSMSRRLDRMRVYDRTAYTAPEINDTQE